MLRSGGPAPELRAPRRLPASGRRASGGAIALRDSGGPPEPRTSPIRLRGAIWRNPCGLAPDAARAPGPVAGIRGALFKAEKDARMRHYPGRVSGRTSPFAFAGRANVQPIHVSPRLSNRLAAA